MPDYGVDFSGVTDMDFGLTTVSGPLAVAQAVARELVTPYGSLFYAPEYGNDLRRYLNGQIVDPGAVANSVEATALRDERVLSATANVTFANETLRIVLRLAIDGLGPFDFTLTVDQLSANVLKGIV